MVTKGAMRGPPITASTMQNRAMATTPTKAATNLACARRGGRSTNWRVQPVIIIKKVGATIVHVRASGGGWRAAWVSGWSCSSARV